MGTLTCRFRKCHASSARYPRLHFFRFPFNNPERSKKWMKYCQLSQHNLVRRVRTLICARHFRMECFMNYKMDRLTNNATPTLIRLSKDKALDFELDIEKGVLITLEQTTLEHLIPPDDFESPLYIENDKLLLHMLKTYELSAASTKTGECATNKIEKNMLNHVQPQPMTSLMCPKVLKTNEFDAGPKRTEECSIDEKLAISSSNTSKVLKTYEFSAASKRTRQCAINETVDDDTRTKKLKKLNSAVSPEIMESCKEMAVSFTREQVKCNSEHKGGSIDLSDSEDKDESLLVPKTHDSDAADSVKQHDTYIKKKNEEGNDYLKLKICLLEEENSLLRASCKEISDKLHKNVLQLEMRNNQMERILKHQKVLEKEIANCSKEYKKLKEENRTIEYLKAQLHSSVKETEELKKMVRSLKSKESNNVGLEISSLLNEGEVKQEGFLLVKSEFPQIEINSKIKQEKDD